MNPLPFTKRSAAAVAVAALTIAPLALAGPAQAYDQVRQATTYVDTTYYVDTLGLTQAQSDSNVLEQITYDRFNWLLQQPTADTNITGADGKTYPLKGVGQLAFLVGSPSDKGFKAAAQKAVTEAQAKGLSKVYWFDPNLSGYTDTRNLDIRKPAGINLAATSQNLFGNLWTNILNLWGTGKQTESAAFSSGLGGAGGTAAYYGDHWGTTYGPTTQALVNGLDNDDTFFFVFNRDNGAATTPDKIVNFKNLSTLSESAEGTYLHDHHATSPYDAAWTAYVNAYAAASATYASAHDGYLVAHPGDEFGAQDAGLAALVATQTDLQKKTSTTAGVQAAYVSIISTVTAATSGTAAQKAAAAAAAVDAFVNAVFPAATADAYDSALDSLGAAAVGAIKDQGQYVWWKAETDRRLNGHNQTTENIARYNATVFTGDDDEAATEAGWRVKQLTYPQLLHVLNTSGNNQVPILFGGTWCPNTRAVNTFINQEAQENGVPVVYNFDFVLDGGATNGTNGGGNPIHIRDAANSGATNNFRPSYLYGDVFSTYFKNVNTEYSPQLGNGSVSYYPGGDLTSFPKYANKAQVPFVLSYQRGTGGSPSGTAVKRQWIQAKLDPNTGLPVYKEYMSQPYYTNPSTNLALSNAQFPLAIGGVPRTQGDPDSVADDAAFLTPDENTALTSAINALTGTKPTSLQGAVNALAALSTPSSPVTAPTGGNIAGLITTWQGNLATDQAENPQVPADIARDTQILNLYSVWNLWNTALTRKNTQTSALSQLAFGQEAVQKLDYFFGGLPGGVLSKQDVTSAAVSYGANSLVNVAITNDYGRVPSGNVSLTLNGKPFDAKQVTKNAASFDLGKLSPGSYPYSLSYAGDDQIASFTKSGSFTVAKASLGGLTGSFVQAPTATNGGSYSVKVPTASGLAKATGGVVLTLTKGSASQTFTATLADGAAAVALPKLAPGDWTSRIAYAGDQNYSAATAAGAPLVVDRARVGKVVGTVSTAPTTKKAGKYKVTIAVPSGLAKANGGKVALKVKKGSTTKTLTGTLSNGVVSIALPKLAKGVWAVAISWAGNADYLGATGKGAAVKVTK